MSNDPHLESHLTSLYHSHHLLEHQTSSVLVKQIRAPVDIVWSLVRRFDKPQGYKPFVQSCTMHGDVKVGSVRDVRVISGLPATTSTEMLDTLDEEQHILSYRCIGGDHRLQNYKSIITLHPHSIDGNLGTLVIESYVVDVPEGNTQEDTRFFVEALVKCNLKSLADISERHV